MTHFLRRNEIPRSTMATRWDTVITIFPILALIQGMLVLFGGQERWYGSSLEVMMTSFVNATLIAGSVLAGAGFLLIVAVRADFPFLVWLTSWICALWYFVALACTIDQLIKTPDGVGTLGPVAWFAFGLIHVVQAQGRVDVDPQPVEDPSDHQNK